MHKDCYMEQRIVLVTDSERDLVSADLANIHMEGNSIASSKAIRDAISTFASVILYTELEDFCENIQEHIDDLVFPMRYGPTSRTGKGLVASLCESYGISYLGADNYTQLLCNDKDLSKKYAQEFGFSVPKSVLFRQLLPQEEMLRRLYGLKLPLVVKPNFGGGSAGISNKSLVHNYNAAIELVSFHLNCHPTPVLVEEYIAGEEVSILLIGNRKRIKFCNETQLLINGRGYFKDHIWGYEDKKIDDSIVDYRPSCRTTQADRNRAMQLFNSFEKVEYMRIDGRVSPDGFCLLELSPDCYLGPDSDFSVAMRAQGLDYPEMLKFIIDNFLNPD